MLPVCARRTDSEHRDDAKSNEPLSTEQFIEFYYNQFDSDRKGLNALYVSRRLTTCPSSSAR